MSISKNDKYFLDQAWSRLLKLVGFDTLSTFTLSASVDITSEATTLYVTSTGNDSNSGTESAPFLTIQAAIDSVPKNIKHPVTINVGAGSFAGFVIDSFNIQNAAVAANGSYINVVGTLATATGLATGTATGTATAGTAGSDQTTTWGTLTDGAATWTVNDLRGKIIETLTGTGSLQTAIIASNTATAITICGPWTAPANGTTYAIRDWATVLTSAVTDPGLLTVATTTSATGTLAASNANFAVISRDNNVSIRGAGSTTKTTGAIVLQRLKTTTLGFIVSGANNTLHMKLCGQVGAALYGVRATFGASVYINQSNISGSIFGVYLDSFGVGKGGVGATINATLFSGNTIGAISGGAATLVVTNSAAFTMANCAFSAGIVTGAALQVTGCIISGCTFTGIGAFTVSTSQASTPWTSVTNTDISSSTTAIHVHGPQGATYLSGVTGTGNTTGIFLDRGSAVQVSSNTTLTGTTEVSIDGTSSALATMRAASPKIVTNTYGTKFFE